MAIDVRLLPIDEIAVAATSAGIASRSRRVTGSGGDSTVAMSWLITVVTMPPNPFRASAQDATRSPPGRRRAFAGRYRFVHALATGDLHLCSIGADPEQAPHPDRLPT